MKFKNILGGSIATALGLSAVLVMPLAAEAHTPSISGSCKAVVLSANSYDASKANTWEAKIGSEEFSGTFGASLSKSFDVPQEAATTDWSATIKAEDGSYPLTKSGTVGPCGTTTIQLPKLDTAPATCTGPGSFVPNFLEWPAAQNANGYEGDGFRVYLDKAYSGSGTYVATLQKVGPGFDPKYPNGTKVVGETSQTLVIEHQLSDETCAGDKPEDKVVTSEWKDIQISCNLDWVYQTRTVTTTKYILVGQTWELDPTSTTVVTETGNRDKTADEVKRCVEVPQPILTESDESTTICELSRVRTVTSYFISKAIWNPETLKYDSFSTPELIRTSTADRPATDEELTEADCPVGDSPEDVITKGVAHRNAYKCGDEYVTYTQVWTTTPWKLEGRVWVPDPDNATTKTLFGKIPVDDVTRDSACIEIVHHESTYTPDGPDKLAFTGFDPLLPGGLALGLMGLGTAYFVRRKFHKA